MAADLGGSQISALLESVPGIRNVLRSPVADALVNTIRAAVGLRPFAAADAEELIQYAVRRGLINQTEGDQVLEDVRGTGLGKTRAARPGKSAARKPTPPKPPAFKKPAFKKPVAKKPVAKKPAAKKPAPSKPARAKTSAKAKPPARRPVKKR
ncbi:MAG TPA: hypothetical protein VLC48_01725 [Gemmatimonadota bacterium]|nr:hypothetical protein [Gemmatimonadota bacterium]